MFTQAAILAQQLMVWLTGKLVNGLGIETVLVAATHGGFEVMSPTPSNEYDALHFRTLIELDGDIVTFVNEAHRDDLKGMKEHFQAVNKALLEVVKGIRRLLLFIAAVMGGGVAIVGVLICIGDDIELMELTGISTAVFTTVASLIFKQFRNWLLELSFSTIAGLAITRFFSVISSEEVEKFPDWDTGRLF